MPVAKNRKHVERALRRGGASPGKAARIANAGKTKKGRKRMARKAARTRRRRRR
jgi:hypothetical protein